MTVTTPHARGCHPMHAADVGGPGASLDHRGALGRVPVAPALVTKAAGSVGGPGGIRVIVSVTPIETER